MSEFTALPEYETIRQIIDEKLSREGIRHEFAPMPEGEHLVFMVEDAPAVNDAFKDLEKATRASAPRAEKELSKMRERAKDEPIAEKAAHAREASSRLEAAKGKGTRYLARRRDEGEMRPLSQAIAVSAASIACFCAGDALRAQRAHRASRGATLSSFCPKCSKRGSRQSHGACRGAHGSLRPLGDLGTQPRARGHVPTGRGTWFGRWGTLKEGRAFMDRKDPANNILLSRDFALALKPKRFDLKHDRNRNVCVLGGPGSGKTRYYVKPNIMQKNADFFVTDPKGTLLGEVGWTLEDAGYDIRTFDTTDFSRSMHYNPLAYVSDQADILVFVECLIKNTTAEDRKGADPFWENSERLLYTALVAYLVYHAKPEERDLNSLMLLLSLAEHAKRTSPT
mgnify:CR=1 FL=1